MNFESKYNTKVPAVKRLMLEALELKEPTEDYSAYPLEDNLFEWHFTVKGATGTEFENGLYHGRIVFPNEYPMKPPNIILLTPNGRFEINKKICLSISGHHPETWIPSWSIRTALLALIAFMPSPGKGTLGSLDYTPEERKLLAKKSRDWKCTQCGILNCLLGKITVPATSAETNLINCVQFKGEENKVGKETVAVEAITETKSGCTTPMEPECSSVSVTQFNMSPLGDTQMSGFWITERTSNFLIAVIVVILSFLIYRRLFIL